MSIARTPQLGSEFRTILRYSQEATLNPGVGGAAATYQFMINSLYDPDYTGTGHQPMGYDQLMGLYNRYLVYGVGYEITMIFGDTTASRQAVVGTHVNLSSSTSTDWTVYAENPETDFRVLESIGSQKTQTTFKGFIDIAKVYGMKRSEIETEHNFWGQTAASPTSKVYLNLFAAGGQTTDTGAVHCYIRFTFYSKMHQFNLQAQS